MTFWFDEGSLGRIWYPTKKRSYSGSRLLHIGRIVDACVRRREHKAKTGRGSGLKSCRGFRAVRKQASVKLCEETAI